MVNAPGLWWRNRCAQTVKPTPPTMIPWYMIAAIGIHPNGSRLPEFVEERSGQEERQRDHHLPESGPLRLDPLDHPLRVNGPGADERGRDQQQEVADDGVGSQPRFGPAQEDAADAREGDGQPANSGPGKPVSWNNVRGREMFAKIGFVFISTVA